MSTHAQRAARKRIRARESLALDAAWSGQSILRSGVEIEDGRHKTRFTKVNDSSYGIARDGETWQRQDTPWNARIVREDQPTADVILEGGIRDTRRRSVIDRQVSRAIDRTATKPVKQTKRAIRASGAVLPDHWSKKD